MPARNLDNDYDSWENQSMSYPMRNTRTKNSEQRDGKRTPNAKRRSIDRRAQRRTKREGR